MKRCPRCDRSFPESEAFCDLDGTKLVAAGAPRETFTLGEEGPGPSAAAVECPVCGGKAQAGEIICNFCGTRLAAAQPEDYRSPGEEAPTPFALGSQPTSRVSLEPGEEEPAEEAPESGWAKALRRAGYAVAAVAALIGGAYLAVHLSSRPEGEKAVAVASPSPVASPAPGPMARLAENMPVVVQGPSAMAAERNQDATQKVFADNAPTVLDVYRHALEADSSLDDAMIVRLHVRADGTVSAATIKISTAPNPGLDAEVAKAMMGWRFAPSSAGEAEVEYPMVFATNGDALTSAQAQLKEKLANFNPVEPPEYAWAHAPEAASAGGTAPKAPEIVAATPAAPNPPAPELSSVEPRKPSSAEVSPGATSAAPGPPNARLSSIERPKGSAREAHARRPTMLAPSKPKVTLLAAVQERLRLNRRLGRVRAYTDRGTVTLYGRVFDDDDRLLAERVTRGVPGVGKVVNTLTTDTSQWAAEEARIAQQLQNAGLPGVTIKIVGRDAYLNGEVRSEADKQRAVTITEAAAPVVVRTNLIRVAPGEVFGF
jgi:TonB family protein